LFNSVFFLSAVIFKNAKKPEKAIEAYERAAEGQERLSSYPYLFIVTEHEGQFYTFKDFP
jgi:hypothetical protein